MIYERQSYVTSNMCDSKLKLSILAADGIVENAVTELMGDLNIDGIVAMEKYDAMWLIVKNNIRFIRRPGWREAFNIRSYISGHTTIKMDIDTLVETVGGELLLKARTELAAIDLKSGRIRKAETVGFSSEMEHPIKTECLEFSRFQVKSANIADTITVNSTSLDYCYHTNNIEYVRFVLNTYDSDYFKKHEPDQLEIHYISQSFENDKLNIEKTFSEEGDLFSIVKDGKQVTACKIVWKKENIE